MSKSVQEVQRKKPTAIEYRKHNPVELDKRAIKRTVNDSARFKSGIRPLEFAKLYASANPIPPDVDPDDALNYWKKLDQDIGASDGQLTSYIIIKRYCCTVHARPISETELRQQFNVKNL
jgi:hypothetical protein